MVFHFLMASALVLSGAILGFIYGVNWSVEYARRQAANAEAKRKTDAEPFPEPDPEEDEADDGEDDIDVCLRVGMHVVCRLSNASHAHGVLVGFAMSPTPDGPMLAVVDVNAPHPMPIDVDLVEPSGHAAPAGYRESANSNKRWN